VATIPFGISSFDSYAVPFAVPYPVPYAVPYAVPVYAPSDSRREREPAEPARRPAPGKSRMIVVDSAGGDGSASIRIETRDDSRVRLTWTGTSDVGTGAREAELFVADSARRPIRSRRVDAATPVALLDLRGLGDRIAYAGVSVELAHGTILTTLVPFDVGARRARLAPARQAPAR
jgi:hypothetical protein